MKIKDLLYIGIIIILIIIYFFKPINSRKLESLEKERTELIQKISVQKDSILKISGEQVKIENEVDSMKSSFKENQIRYVTNTKEFKIKDSIINSYSIDQLQSFFTDRYK